MGLRSLCCALAVATLSCGGAAAQPSSRTALIQFAPSIVKIEAVDAQGNYQLGSGVIVAPRKVVTNCHVTRKARRITVLKHGLRHDADRQFADTGRDLCLLRVAALEGDPVPIGRASLLKAGDVVTAVGYTGGIGVQLSDGEVVAKHRWSGSDVIQSTNGFNSGASGGALFDAHGALVGILTFRLRGGAAHYFSAPADWLLERLDDEPALGPVQPLSGLPFWEEAVPAQPLFLQAAAMKIERQWDGLARLAERRLSEAATDAEAHYLRGVALDELGRSDDAIESLQHCIDHDPRYSQAWVRLAQVYRKQGRWDEARRMVSTLTRNDPRTAESVAAELE
ncbi:MAG TPA: trypsin-like peptidase domain-containing protein [Methylibium sp.]|nr:trypsin-like peptidase domain-containing protein [Methylibium sp.]